MGSAVAASTAFHLGLGETDKKMCAGTQGCLMDHRSLWGQSFHPLLTSSCEQPYLPHPMGSAPGIPSGTT